MRDDQARIRGGWRRAGNDLGLRIIWFLDADGDYTARWEPQLTASAGRYRFLITAKRYRLKSKASRCGRREACG